MLNGIESEIQTAPRNHCPAPRRFSLGLVARKRAIAMGSTFARPGTLPGPGEARCLVRGLSMMLHVQQRPKRGV